MLVVIYLKKGVSTELSSVCSSAIYSWIGGIVDCMHRRKKALEGEENVWLDDGGAGATAGSVFFSMCSFQMLKPLLKRKQSLLYCGG